MSDDMTVADDEQEARDHMYDLLIETCGQEQAKCVCVKPAGHVEEGDDTHTCEDSCGGAWRMVGGQFRVVEFPGVPGLAKALGL